MNIGETGGRSQDFDLNLAPIIDCFTVLITFMLASASFLAIGAFDTAASTPGKSDTTVTPPPVQLEVEMNIQKELRFKVEGKTKLDKVFPPFGNEYDSAALIQELNQIREQFPSVDTLTLSAGDDVQYVHLILMMEKLKPHIPTTLLGGFQ